MVPLHRRSPMFISSIFFAIAFISSMSSSFGDKTSSSAVNLVLIVCDNAAESGFQDTVKTSYDRQKSQTLTLLKSVLVTWVHAKADHKNISGNTRAQDQLNIILYSNGREVWDDISQEITSWENKYTQNLTLLFRQVIYPEELAWMRSKYAPCATFRMLFPQQLLLTDPHLERVLYLDTDMLVLRDIRQLWKQFVNFSEKTIVGSQISGDPTTEFVEDLFSALRKNKKMKKDSKLVIVNPGLLLVNLANWRASTNWIPWLKNVQKELLVTKYPEMAAISAYFTLHPEQHYQVRNTWNIRADCITKRNPISEICNTEGKGLSILHGGFGAFYTSKPGGLLQIVNNHFEKLDLTNQLTSPPRFVHSLRRKVQREIWNCDKVARPKSKHPNYCKNIATYSEMMFEYLNELE